MTPIVVKIRKLRALADDERGNPNEREAAAAAARKLAARLVARRTVDRPLFGSWGR
jgi:hypothetical protein